MQNNMFIHFSLYLIVTILFHLKNVFLGKFLCSVIEVEKIEFFYLVAYVLEDFKWRTQAATSYAACVRHFMTQRIVMIDVLFLCRAAL